MCLYNIFINFSFCLLGFLVYQFFYVCIQYFYFRSVFISIQVVVEFFSEFSVEAWGKFRVQREVFMQFGQLQILQDVVRQFFDIGIGFDYLFTLGQFIVDQIIFFWGEEVEVSKFCFLVFKQGSKWRLLSGVFLVRFLLWVLGLEERGVEGFRFWLIFVVCFIGFLDRFGVRIL